MLPHFDPAWIGCCIECRDVVVNEHLCHDCGMTFCSRACKRLVRRDKGRVKHQELCALFQPTNKVNEPLRQQLSLLLREPDPAVHQRFAQLAIATGFGVQTLVARGAYAQAMRHVQRHGVTDDQALMAAFARDFRAVRDDSRGPNDLLLLLLGLLHLRAPSNDAFAQAVIVADVALRAGAARCYAGHVEGTPARNLVFRLEYNNVESSGFLAPTQAGFWRKIQHRHVALLVTLVPTARELAADPRAWLRVLVVSAPWVGAIVVRGPSEETPYDLGAAVRDGPAQDDDAIAALLQHVDALCAADMQAPAAVAHVQALMGWAPDTIATQYHVFTLCLNLALIA
jgi:hypothetical protein